jgi:hypothetical protein
LKIAWRREDVLDEGTTTEVCSGSGPEDSLPDRLFMLEVEGKADSRLATDSYLGVERPAFAGNSTDLFDPELPLTAAP